MYNLDLGKADEPEIKLPTSIQSQKKKGNSRKTSTSSSLTMLKPLAVWITTNCGKFLKKWEYQTILTVSCETCMQIKKQQLKLDREQGTMDWFKTGKGIHQGFILSPCLFNLYVKYIMQYARLDEAHAGIKIAERIINNLRYANDTILVAEIAEELKNLSMKVKEESEQAELKFNIQKMKIMASGLITSWPILGKKMETVTDFIFLGSKINTGGDCSHEIKKCLFLGRKAMTKLDSVLKK